MVGKITKDNFLSFVMTLLCCLLFLGTSYRSMSMIVLVLSILVLLVGYFIQKPKVVLEKKERFFVYALVFFFISALLSFVVGKGWELQSVRNPNMPSLIDLDLPSKYLLGALVFVLFIKDDFKICKPAIMGAIGLGAIINGVIAIYQRYVLGYSRIDGFSGIAEMADASAILSLFSLVCFVFAGDKKAKIFFFIATFMGSMAAILTGTRGAMLGIILALLALSGLIWFFQKKMIKATLVTFFSIGLAFSVGYFFSGGNDMMRIQSAQQDIALYHEGEAGTSLGARFEMWKEAVAMFQMAPIFGLSTAEIKDQMPQILEKSGSRFYREQSHQQAIGNKHNQILNSAAKRGIVGVIAIILVWLSYAILFYQYLKRDQSLFPSLCALIMLFYYLFPNSITGDVWESNVSVPLIFLSVAIFYKWIRMELESGN